MKFANISRSVNGRLFFIISLLTMLLSVHHSGLATPYLTPAELEQFSGYDFPQRSTPQQEPSLRPTLDEVAYFAEYVQICDFLVRLQHPGPGTNAGGMIEGETGHVATIVQTDNTLEAIRVWSQYGVWTQDTTLYKLPITRAWEYGIRYPAWQEENSPGGYGYYRSHNCGWGIVAEMKYREVYSDTTYKWYADECASYLASHSLPFNQGSSGMRRLLPLIQGWSAGTLYLYAMQEGNDAWRETALTEARRVRDWIEESPARLYNNEEWALSGGTALWGVCASLFDAYPDSGGLWLPSIATNLELWQPPTGSWNNAWNTWYGHAHHLVFVVLQDSTYWDNAVYIADSLLRFDTDDDGGITANGFDADSVDQSWVSSYLNWMDLERIINVSPEADIAAANFVSPSSDMPHRAGDSLTVAVRVINVGWSELDSVLVKVEGEFEDSLYVDFRLGLDTTVTFETPWVSPILQNQPELIPLTLSVYHADDMRPDNDTAVVYFDIRQSAFIEGAIFAEDPNLNVAGTRLTFYHNAFPDTPVVEYEIIAEGTFVFAAPFMLGDYTVEVFPPLALMPTSIDFSLTEAWSYFHIFILLEPTQIALIDDDAGAFYETYLLTTLGEFPVSFRHWDVLFHGVPELDNVPVILWMTGNDSTTTLTPEDQTAIESYLSDGGSLLLTGQDITEDLQTGATFLRDVLHCDVREHDVGSRHLYGTVNDPVSEGLEIYITGTGGAGNQHAPSSLEVLEGSTECFHYATDDSFPAGVQGEYGSGKYIFLAFGLEGVSGMLQSNTRTDILTRAFDFFGVSAAPRPRHGIPTTISLSQNWPNPFNSTTTISFFAPPGENPVHLVLYNLLGQRVRTLFSGTVQGYHSLRWDGRDNHGHDLPTGMYLYVLQTPDETRARKLLLIR